MNPLLCQLHFKLVGLQKKLQLENVQMVPGHEALQAFGIIGLKS